MIDEGAELGVCAINVTEFYAGVAAEQRAIWDEFFQSLAYYEISRDAAVQAGKLRHALARRGSHVSTADALMAAVALEHGGALATDMPKDYPVVGLRVLSLRSYRI